VQILNILALAGLLGFAWRQVDPRIKENWLWTMALVCVNPIAVLLQRKIWTQSTLPLFCLLFILGWSRRDRWGGALLWGFLGAWLGQIHLSGFFFAAAVVIWTTASRLLQKQSRAVAWGPWAIGSIIGITYHREVHTLRWNIAQGPQATARLCFCSKREAVVQMTTAAAKKKPDK